MTIKENISLARFNTFRSGGTARYFTETFSLDDIHAALSFSKEESVPFLILGEGSNVLISDDGFPGLVIKMGLSGMLFEEKDADTVSVTAAAGVHFDSLVSKSVSMGLYGLENLSGIPGTVGAAPVQNIGAYGAEIKNTLVAVEVLDVESGKIFLLSRDECKFSYRDSIFKKENRLIVLSVNLILKKTGQLSTLYRDIDTYLKEHHIEAPTVSDIRHIVLDIRARKLPSLEEYGTAGSFFKNIVLGEKDADALQRHFPTMPLFPLASGGKKIPTAWILDNICGLKGFRKGSVGLYEKQPLAIVNLGEAASSAIKEMSDFIINSVRKKTGIILEPEVCFIGDFK